MMHTRRWIFAAATAATAAVGAAACSDAAAPPLEWVTPGEEGVAFAGEVVELAVTGPEAEGAAVDFFVDGERVATCDPTQPEEDCKLGEVWRWSVALAQTGTHTIGASYEADGGVVAIERTIDVRVAPPESELLEGEGELAQGNGGGAEPPDPEPVVIDAANRGLLDPARAFHRAFGGIAWSVKNQRVVLHTGTPLGSVSAVRACMNRYGASIRKWADHYKLSRASVVATALTESSCTNPAGSSDGLSSGPMQVTASTCAAITGLSRATCRSRMHTKPDFSFEVGAKYMGSSFQRGQHHRDPPKIAAAYNAGSLRSTTANRWHMVTTGNHIDRFVSHYNAYRKWEAQAASSLIGDVEPRFEGEHVAKPEDLPASAAEGQVVFVGDFAARDGAFWQRTGGVWRSTDAAD